MIKYYMILKKDNYTMMECIIASDLKGAMLIYEETYGKEGYEIILLYVGE